MKLLVIGAAQTHKYPGVFCKNFRRALDFSRIQHDFFPLTDNPTVPDGYDFYIGAGDEMFRRMPELVASIKAGGGKTIDIRTKKLPNKPKTLFKTFFQNEKYQADFVLTHMKDRRSNCFYIGQGFDETLLYPEQDELFTVFVDHSMPRRNSQTQKILSQCRTLFGARDGVRIWYQNSQGVVENMFEEDKVHYRPIPFEELSAYYRKTHVFLPTHRETQGIVAAEIGMCGGVTLLQKWMYPNKTISHIPHQFYRSQIDWPGEVDIEANMNFTKKHYGLQAYASRIKIALDEIGAIG